MICQICGTRDDQHNRGPVRVFNGEGICRVCKDEVGVVKVECETGMITRMLHAAFKFLDRRRA